MDSQIIDIARSLAAQGGRAVLVGGWVRDHLLGIPSKDVDIEVFGLSPQALEGVLGQFGEVITVGRAFGVLRVKGLDIDFSLPRRDSKRGSGHRGFAIEIEPDLPFELAASRRDLTINSIGLDMLSGAVLDPFGGQADLRAGRLRATNAAHFAEDPLRALRAAQFAARLEMTPDSELLALCAQQDLSEVSGERIFGEFRKLLLKGRKPSLGLKLLHDCNLLRYFPELQALVGVEQDPRWHPEGDVWIHTLMVLDEASLLRATGRADSSEGSNLALMFGALCHDFGKPVTTYRDGEHIRSPAHDVEGVAPAQAFLQRMRAPAVLVKQTCALVQHHLAPALFVKSEATAKAYRRLARKLSAADITFELLLDVATADHFGRTTADALAREFPAGEAFIAAARELQVDIQTPVDVVQGRHLIARGLTPGPGFKDILARCRDLQDEMGWTDPEAIISHVLD